MMHGAHNVKFELKNQTWTSPKVAKMCEDILQFFQKKILK
jgi:hypothetical protein